MGKGDKHWSEEGARIAEYYLIKRMPTADMKVCLDRIRQENEKLHRYVCIHLKRMRKKKDE